MTRLLVQFVHEQSWVDFRGLELISLFALQGIHNIDIQPSSSMLLILHHDIDINIIYSICSRSVLVKAIYELISSSNISIDDLASQLLLSQYASSISSSSSWSLTTETLNKSISHEQKESIRLKFKGLNLLGPIQLKNPDIDLRIVIEYPWIPESSSSSSLNSDSADIFNMPCHFCRLISNGGMRDALKKYDLRFRLYVGPTSLDHTLALIIANIVNIQPGQLVFDPFVGTASLLIAATHFGAHCFGTDIDIRVLKGDMYAGQPKSDDLANLANQSNVRRDIFGTFDDYALPRPELLRMDNAILSRHLSSQAYGVFDAILTDPPYGIRAGARKSGRSGEANIIPEELRESHFPATQKYAVEEVMLDLLHTSALLLKVGGKLAYLIPTPYDFDAVKDLPLHPCLSIESYCLQRLSTRHGRHFVIMMKTKEYTPIHQQEFMIYKQSVLDGSDTGFSQLMSKLQAALSSEAHNDDSVVKHISSRCAKRKANKIKQAAIQTEIAS